MGFLKPTKEFRIAYWYEENYEVTARMGGEHPKVKYYREELQQKFISVGGGKSFWKPIPKVYLKENDTFIPEDELFVDYFEKAREAIEQEKSLSETKEKV